LVGWLVAHLADSFESTHGELHADLFAKRVREETFGLNVWEPCATCLFLRERDVVSVLLGLSMEQPELRPLEWLAERGGKRG
jgi:hypothetical protein